MSFTNNQTQLSLPDNQVFTPHFTISSDATDSLIMEGGDDFYDYVNRLGLAKSNMIVLSSKHHYYYDTDEIKNAKTFVHLKELNLINQIRDLLSSYMSSLPENCNFIGSFVNNDKYGRFALKNRLNHIESKKNSEYAGLHIVSHSPFVNMIYNILDRKTNSYLTEENVVILLNEFNFEILDMTEKNERTYFCARKVTKSYN